MGRVGASTTYIAQLCGGGKHWRINWTRILEGKTLVNHPLAVIIITGAKL